MNVAVTEAPLPSVVFGWLQELADRANGASADSVRGTSQSEHEFPLNTPSPIRATVADALALSTVAERLSALQRNFDGWDSPAMSQTERDLLIDADLERKAFLDLPHPFRTVVAADETESIGVEGVVLEQIGGPDSVDGRYNALLVEHLRSRGLETSDLPTLFDHLRGNPHLLASLLPRAVTTAARHKAIRELLENHRDTATVHRLAGRAVRRVSRGFSNRDARRSLVAAISQIKDLDRFHSEVAAHFRAVVARIRNAVISTVDHVIDDRPALPVVRVLRVLAPRAPAARKAKR